MQAPHPVRLVAPWYHWQRQRHEPAPFRGPLPRGTRPVFQKYDATDMVNRFIRDPQWAYAFTADDRVYAREGSPYRAASPFDPASPSIRSTAEAGRLDTGVRKLFRNTHRRSYLVVCELHCDVPGLPDAAWDHVCEMGFVMRRRQVEEPERYRAKAKEIRDRIGLLRAHLLRLRGVHKNLRAGTTSRESAFRLNFLRSIDGRILRHEIESFEMELSQRRAELRALESLGRGAPPEARWHLERWLPDPDHDRIGSWRPLASATPQTVEEKVYPLFPLIPDPQIPRHTAQGARLLFGNVPTDGLETDRRGEPYLDPDHLYEIRCFVRQHRPGCPRRPGRQDCHGPLVWSEPTELFRLAPHFDPDGTKNVVINVQMPDLPALAAAPAGGGGVRFHMPEGSELNFGPPLMIPPLFGSLGGPIACFFSIPLITLVALFALNILMPIVVNLFRLYYLLALVFCPGSLPLGFTIPAGLPEVKLKLNEMLGGMKDPKDPARQPVDMLLDEYREDELPGVLRNLVEGWQAKQTPDRLAGLVPEPRVEVRPRPDDPALVGPHPLLEVPA